LIEDEREKAKNKKGDTHYLEGSSFYARSMPRPRFLQFVSEMHMNLKRVQMHLGF
jgi:hypothetical protein